MRVRNIVAAGFIAAAAFAGAAAAADSDSYELTIRGHKFEPAELVIPAGKKVRLVVKNADPTAEEFESYDLNREKVVPGGGTVTVYIGPLDPGSYPFFGDFHRATAKGRIVAK